MLTPNFRTFFQYTYVSSNNEHHYLLDINELQDDQIYFFCRSPNDDCAANQIANVFRRQTPNALLVKDLVFERTTLRCYSLAPQYADTFNDIIVRNNITTIPDATQIFSSERVRQARSVIIIPSSPNIIAFQDF